jgi:hypothetical protein
VNRLCVGSELCLHMIHQSPLLQQLMGINCSTDKDQDEPGNHAEKDTQKIKRFPTKLVKKPHLKRPAALITDAEDSKTSSKIGPKKVPRAGNSRRTRSDDCSIAASNTTDVRGLETGSFHTMDAQKFEQYNLVGPMDDIINDRGVGKTASIPDDPDDPVPAEKYEEQRALVLLREKALAFDYACFKKATDLERKAADVVRIVKKMDLERVYEMAEKREGHAGQKHPRVFGDHFLSNVELIERTWLFAIAKKMPKGGHLHIHFNANLRPGVLIGIASQMRRMFISSDIPLLPATTTTEEKQARKSSSKEQVEEPTYFQDLDRCKIQFRINEEPDMKRGDIFDANYGKEEDAEGHQVREWMLFREFRERFSSQFPEYNGPWNPEDGETTKEVDRWLCSKLVFDEREAHNMLQSADG